MTENLTTTQRRTRHWPAMTLGLIVAAIFLVAVFSYQVKETEKAVEVTLGTISGVRDAGLHFRLPYPFQSVYKYDVRLRCFDGNVGKIEETFTRDGKNIVVGIYVVYRIDNPKLFYQSVVNVAEAEDRLNSVMRTTKDAVIGRYDFDQLVNTIPEKMQLDQVISELRSGIASFAETEYGLRIETVGIKSLGIPEKTSENVFERMINERKVVAERYRQEGKRISEQIKAEADKQRELLLADAEAKSKRIRAEGDAEAASHYAAFRKDPQLAAFLRKLDALRKIMSTRTTLILDTDSVPFDLFKMNPGQTSESQTHKKGD